MVTGSNRWCTVMKTFYNSLSPPAYSFWFNMFVKLGRHTVVGVRVYKFENTTHQTRTILQ